jgi:hypothetical protein
MEIAALIAQFLPLGIEATASLIDLIKTAQAAGKTQFTQADEDAFYAATGQALSSFDQAADGPAAS